MLVTLFTPEQVKAFVNLAYRLIHADDKVADEEKEMFELLMSVYPFSEDVIDMELSTKELVESFDDMSSKVYCLVNLGIIAHIDGEFSVKEKEFLNNLGSLMGLDNEMVNAVIKEAEKISESLMTLGKLI